jgi:hypothetical protein
VNWKDRHKEPGYTAGVERATAFYAWSHGQGEPEPEGSHLAAFEAGHRNGLLRAAEIARIAKPERGPCKIYHCKSCRGSKEIAAAIESEANP